MKKEKKRNRKPLLIVLLAIVIAGAAACAVFAHFGGFSTGECAERGEFAKYAGQVTDIAVPEGTRIIALGEATHGNREFQQLKLDVFKIAVEKYGVRAFAIEADTGSCETINSYIHGGGITAQEALESLVFGIYKTDEMAQLIEWMREYNRSAGKDDDVRFYGFDIQEYVYSYEHLLDAMKAQGMDTAELESLWDGDGYSADAGFDERGQVYADIKDELSEKLAQTPSDSDVTDIADAMHLTDVLMQNTELGKLYSGGAAVAPVECLALRDKYMAGNVMWILEREQALGHDMIFVTSHNGHMQQTGGYDKEHKIMGALVADEIGRGAYFAIGTDFWRTRCNLPSMSGKRIVRTFYSHDPLAKAAHTLGYDNCWLDFSRVPADSPLGEQVNGYIFMGDLGENYSILVRVLPYAYRTWMKPSDFYDGMIFVPDAHPIEIG